MAAAFRLPVILLLFFLPLQNNAQLHSNIHYTTLDGLPSQTIYAIMQDSKGFIWMGTQNGLCRFDGKDFKTYTTSDGLPDNEVLKMAEDKMGRLWLSTFNGNACYFKDGRFHSAENDTKLAKIAGLGDYVSYYFPDNESGFWIYGRDKLYYLDYGLVIKSRFDNLLLGIVNKYEHKGIFTTVNSQSITRFAEGRVSSRISTRVPFYMHPLNSHSTFIDTLVYTPAADKRHLFILILNKDYAVTRHLKKTFPYDVNIVYRIGGYYYIANYADVLFRCRETDVLFNDCEVFMKGNVVTGIAQDHEGGLWVGTSGNGLYYFPSDNARTYSLESGLADNNIYSIFQHKGRIYFSDLKGNIYSLHPLKKVLNLASGANACRILKVKAAGNGSIAVATDDGTFLIDLGPPIGIRKIGNASKDIDCIENSIYWATAGGVFSYNRKRIWSYDTISTGRKTCVQADKKNNVWYGGLNSLYRWNETEGEIDYGKKYPELQSRVTAITVSEDSMIWVATRNGIMGLRNDSIVIRISAKEASVFNNDTRISDKEELVSNNIKSLFTRDNRIIAATDKGVDIITCHLPGMYYTIRHIDKFDGLADNEVNSVFEKNDTLYAGTAHGLSVIPLKNELIKVPPRVQITGLSVNGSDVPFDQPVQLPYYKNNITLSFAGLSFRSGTKILYRFKTGKEGVWTNTRNNSLTFPDLSPGVYNFVIEAQAANGEWSTASAVIDLVIEKPFWKRAWFLALMLCLFTFFILYTWRRHISRVKHDLELRNTMLKSEIKALRAQMNPHFIFNSLNSIQHFIFDNRKEEANEYLVQFAKLMRLILENSQNNFISIAEEATFLELYLELERLRLNNKFDFELIYDRRTPLSELLIPSMLLQPFVENSIIHGINPKQGKARLTISFLLNEGYLACIVEDDGVGVQVEKEVGKVRANHHSFGIMALQERVTTINKIYNTDISFTLTDRMELPGNGSGTRVFIRLKAISNITS